MKKLLTGLGWAFGFFFLFSFLSEVVKESLAPEGNARLQDGVTLLCLVMSLGLAAWGTIKGFPLKKVLIGTGWVFLFFGFFMITYGSVMEGFDQGPDESLFQRGSILFGLLMSIALAVWGTLKGVLVKKTFTGLLWALIFFYGLWVVVESVTSSFEPLDNALFIGPASLLILLISAYSAFWGTVKGVLPGTRLKIQTEAAKERNKVKNKIHLIIWGVAMAPLGVALIAAQIASIAHCQLDYSGVHPCYILGHDFGGLLLALTFLHWICIATVQLGILASIINAVYWWRRAKNEVEYLEEKKEEKVRPSPPRGIGRF